MIELGSHLHSWGYSALLGGLSLHSALRTAKARGGIGWISLFWGVIVLLLSCGVHSGLVSIYIFLVKNHRPSGV